MRALVEDRMIVACLDLEGVLVPEIWIQFSERTGIPELRRTTRDEPDYDKLMRWRIALLAEKGFTLGDIQSVIAGMAPLPGAAGFLDWLRARMQVVILSDTFNEFAQPLMKQLGWPTLFCHDLITNGVGRIVDYRLRQVDAKRQAVVALRGLNFQTIAAGDSYNDTRMLSEADQGVLFRPPENVIREFPQFPVASSYDELRAAFERAEAKLR
jgi:phosphoserine/homoserine phosphotransferase